MSKQTGDDSAFGVSAGSTSFLMNAELHTKPEIQVTPRRFTLTLTETQAHQLVERLKFRQNHIPDLSEPVWKPLEKALGYEVTEGIE